RIMKISLAVALLTICLGILSPAPAVQAAAPAAASQQDTELNERLDKLQASIDRLTQEMTDSRQRTAKLDEPDQRVTDLRAEMNWRLDVLMILSISVLAPLICGYLIAVRRLTLLEAGPRQIKTIVSNSAT